jgi:hypothetical protein
VGGGSSQTPSGVALIFVGSNGEGFGRSTLKKDFAFSRRLMKESREIHAGNL